LGLIADILGNIRAAGAKPAPRALADVEAALARLGNERNAARAAVADAMRERDELLLVDETDARIADLDALADRHRLTLERCDKAEPLLLAELEDLRSAAKQACWQDLRARYDAAALEYANAMRGAIQRQAQMLNLNDEARRQGFEREVMSTFIPPTRMLTIEALNDFEAAIERAREMARPNPAPAPRPAPKVAAAPPPPPAPRPKPKPAAAPPSPAKPFVPPTPDVDGRVPIVILRHGIEIEGRDRPRAGETVLVPAEQAAAFVRGGSADYGAQGADPFAGGQPDLVRNQE